MKKIITFVVSVILALTMFTVAGCDNRPVLRMATNAEFPPFEYKDGNKFVGIDIELAQLIADELGYRLVINDMEFESVILSVSNGQSDIALAALTVSEERAQHVDFSDSYFKATQYIVVKIDDTTFDGLETAEEIEDAINAMGNNAKIGFQNGTTGEYYAKGDDIWGFSGFENATKTGYTSGAIAVNEIKDNRLNILVIDEMPARAMVEANPNEIKLIDIALTDEEYAIAVKKGDTELLNKINAALNKFIDNGAFQAIIDRYLGANQ